MVKAYFIKTDPKISEIAQNRPEVYKYLHARGGRGFSPKELEKLGEVASGSALATGMEQRADRSKLGSGFYIERHTHTHTFTHAYR